MKTSKRCASCDRKLRKGCTRRAFVIDPHGGMRSGLVCGRCAHRGVLLVTPPALTVPTACAHCSHEAATVGPACVERLAQQNRELIAANVLARTGAAARPS